MPINTRRIADHPGEYPGFDRFGRVVSQMWVDGSYTTTMTSDPNKPAIVAHALTYDEVSNRTALDDATHHKPDFRSYDCTYDGLDRLIAADAPPSGAGGADIAWDLDMLGNWAGFDPASGDTARSHNMVNELTGIDTDDNGSDDLTLTYDKAGNLRDRDISSTETLTYTHDAWNRLVKVEYDDGTTTSTRGEYEYNGLNWRVRKKADRNRDGTVEQERFMYYTASWQLIEEEVNDDVDQNAVIDREVQYVWGLRYIDDIIMRRENTDPASDDDFDDKIRYYCTDV